MSINKIAILADDKNLKILLRYREYNKVETIPINVRDVFSRWQIIKILFTKKSIVYGKEKINNRH